MHIEFLRGATRDNHQHLEKRLDIVSRCATRDGYQSLLERFYGFYVPYEAMLRRREALAPVALSVRERTRLPQLRADLDALGLTAPQRASLPQCSDVPDPATRAEMLGCLYVTEGSTLGGRLIRRLIQEAYGDAAPPTAFFDGYGEETGARWRALCLAIDAEPFSPDDREAMAQAAREVFRVLETWLPQEPLDTAS